MTRTGDVPTPTPPAATALRCLIVGAGTMPRECADLLRQRGHVVVAVVSDDPELVTWAADAGLPNLPLGDGSGSGWDVADVDVLFSIANLTVLGDAALRLPRIGAVNFHDGPLPARAGLNSPAWAILENERMHGVTWHLMKATVDAGDVLAAEAVPIGPNDTALSLNAACYEAGLRSFATVVDALEVQPLKPLRGGQAPLRRHGRADRPAAGGLLDPGRTATQLATLARALDYGPYPNPLGRPALEANGTTVLVGQVEAVPADGSGVAGTVLGVDATLRLRTADGDVLLSDFERLDGRRASAGEAAAELGLAVAAVVPTADPKMERDFRAVARRWLRHEAAWTRRLAAITPVAGEHLRITGRADASARRTDHEQALGDAVVDLAPATRPGDTLLAIVGLMFARLEPARALDLPFRHVELASRPGTSASRFGSHVPLRVRIPDDAPFGDYLEGFLRELDETVALGGFLCDLPRRRPELAGIDAGWSRQGWPLTVERLPTLDGAKESPVRWDAALTVRIPDDGGACSWRYDPSRVDPATVARLQDRLRALIADLAEGRSVHAARVFTDDERAWLADRNRTDVRQPDEQTVHGAIEAQSRRTPDAAALVAGHRTLSYDQLNARANRLARLLALHGATPTGRVGIMSARSVNMVVAMLAVLKAGAAYVPLDPDFPAERLSFMIDDAQLSLLLVDHRNAERVTGRSEPTLLLDDSEELASGLAADNPDVAIRGDDLAYVIYTSGSTGRPKGVMLEHRNVLSFMVGMDARLEPGGSPGTWLAVTSISFDISVLELLWTLARGFEVVLYSGDDRRRTRMQPPAPSGRLGAGNDVGLDGASADRSASQQAAPAFSLFYFSSDEGEDPADKYRLLLEGARFADRNGFAAVWTPERHFHAFGGLYPNPAVTGAAVAAMTRNVRIRAGSCVLPLHHPIRIAEEWSVVDNLSGGRVDVSFASGWQPDDFVLAPTSHEDRNGVMYQGIETVRALWRGETLTFDGPGGAPVEVATLPRPIQPELPIWITAAGNPATFRKAGEIGAHLLTHMLGQDLEQLAEKIAVYREAWRAAGWPGRGHVSLMLHTYLCDDRERAREVVRGPLRAYLRSSAGLIKRFASSFPAFRGTDATSREAVDARFQALSDADMEALLDHAFDRYFDTSGLFGTIDDGLETVEAVRHADVDELACLIDFGVPTDEVLDGLVELARLRDAVEAGERPARSIPELIARHGVTHLQCTPSMAQMLVADAQGRGALARLDRLLVGGEALPRELARTLASLVKGPLHNMYGPTETTIWSTERRLDRAALAQPGPVVAIGTPIANTRVYVCDEALQPLPPGVPGELVIGGSGVARGYWRRPDVTAERFVPDHLASAIGHGDATARSDERLYRTGDLARWTSEGELEYLGRLDFQVKIRGHRVELGEIEAVLDEHPSVRQAVVAARRGAGGDARLVAYVLPVPDLRPVPETLIEHLASRLPEVMVPSAVMLLDAFPLTPNKKIDRKALPEPLVTPDDAPGFVAPVSDLERLLATIWARVLSVDTVGAHDDFFSLGGNSLLAVFVISEIAKHGHELTLAQLLDTPTVSGLAKRLEAVPPTPTPTSPGVASLDAGLDGA